MHLVAYLEEIGMKIPEAASEIGCARNTLWRIAKRWSRPSPELAKEIVRWSKKKIGLAELLDVLPDRPRRRNIDL